MGGRGSGIWHRSGQKRLVEGTLHIDAGKWRREGVITPGERRTGTYVWQRGFVRIASVRYETACSVTEGVATLAYRRGAQRITQRLTLVTIPSNLGVGRWWAFLCPRCERRARLLYLSSEGFTCRRCAGLAYRSQREWHIPERLARRIAPHLGHSVEDVTEVLREYDPTLLRIIDIILS